jgi:DNA polymerase I
MAATPPSTSSDVRTPPSTPAALLLDSHSLLFRAFYALPPMSTAAGEPTGALYGLAVLLLKLLREERPGVMAFAVDAPARTVRREQYPEYKAGRAPAPDPLRAQLARFPELIEALGVPVHAVPGWEGDDVLATLAARVRPSLVVSGDTDLLQIVDDDTHVLFVGRRQKDHVRYDLPAVRARYGFEPARIPTYKALCGDASDHLPGIPGVGAKTAARLVAEHGDAGAILAAALPPKLRPAIEAHDLRRWEALATVRADLPLSEPLAAPPDLGERLEAWFTALEFRSLIPRLHALRAATR